MLDNASKAFFHFLAGSGFVKNLASKYGMSRAQAEAAIGNVTAAAAGEGLDFHLDVSLRSNTFDAHRVIHLAAVRGIQDAVKERLMRAYFTEGEPVGDSDALVRIATDAGLDAALGISGVPFFVVDRKYGVSGAQPADQLLAVLERAWSERSPFTLVGSGQAGTDEVCGPDGCPI